MARHNLGKITGSTASAFLTGAKPDRLIAGNFTACSSIVSELLEKDGICISDPDFDDFNGNRETEYGNAYESEAIKRYEDIMFDQVHSKQEQITKGKWYSCTVDGFVGKSGVIEVKVVTKLTGWINIDIDDVVKKHNDQIQLGLYLSGRLYCDLILYMPRFNPPYDIIIKRLYPDKNWLSFFETRMPLCIEQIESNYNNFKSIQVERIQLTGGTE